jgi:hypothetical protein
MMPVPPVSIPRAPIVPGLDPFLGMDPGRAAQPTAGLGTPANNLMLYNAAAQAFGGAPSYRRGGPIHLAGGGFTAPNPFHAGVGLGRTGMFHAPSIPRISSLPTGSSRFVISPTPGRADAVSARVPHGTYVVPADVVSGKGQGNSLAGAHSLDRRFSVVPRATMFRRGGMVDVRLSGGELLVHPEVVAGLGKGSLERGAKALDSAIVKWRRKNAKAEKKLPGPRK